MARVEAGSSQAMRPDRVLTEAMGNFYTVQPGEKQVYRIQPPSGGEYVLRLMGDESYEVYIQDAQGRLWRGYACEVGLFPVYIPEGAGVYFRICNLGEEESRGIIGWRQVCGSSSRETQN